MWSGCIDAHGLSLIYCVHYEAYSSQSLKGESKGFKGKQLVVWKGTSKTAHSSDHAQWKCFSCLVLQTNSNCGLRNI